MTWLALIIVTLAVFITSVQVWAHRKARRMRGKPAPPLEIIPGWSPSPGKPVLIYFHAPGCRACRTMTPLVRELQRERNDVYMLNAAEEKAAARAFGVMATPATVRVRDGRITDVILGPRQRSDLLRLLQEK
ncbi:MAG: thioredoxin family protein [Candidatus Aminicenantes bacterium]|nr:thioredoxin family protein [Candidatus Aminicenantes bacterium]